MTHGFKQSAANYSLFTLKRENSFTALLVYVDDIVLSGNDLSIISHITILLDETFKIKDLGNLKYFLGFKVLMEPLVLTFVKESMLWIFSPILTC